LVDNCDEFIYYEDLLRATKKAVPIQNLPEKRVEVFAMVTDAIRALQRENKEILWGSMIKQTMKRKRPDFDEGYYGYSTFSKLLEDAAKQGILELKKDQRSGTYIITGFTEVA
jgi:hypothetical protein